MKRTFRIILLSMIIAYGFFACEKSTNSSGQSPSNQTLIESAERFFDNQVEKSSKSSSGNARTAAAKNPNWTAAKILQLSNEPAVVVPVQYVKNLYITTNFGGSKLFNLNEITYLVIYKDRTGTYEAELVTGFPDSNALKPNAAGFTGVTFVEGWTGNRLRQFKYNSNGAILSYNAQYGSSSGSSGISTIPSAIAPATVIATCYEISGYNYSPDDPDGGYYWTEPAGCDYQYIASDPVGGGSGLSGGDYGSISGGGSSVSKPTSQIVIESGPNIIGSIQDYFKCYTNSGASDHLYTVTLCVDQPVPGTRQSWGFSDGASGTSATGNPFNVGHTFLIFSETYGGATTTRNVGFYPRTAVNPVYPSDQGQLNDNESSGYNISLTITLNNGQFFNMLNYVSLGNNAGYLYNLNSNNCTTFALDALQAGSVNISTRTGSWVNGSGYDPGDLGEDIRSMILASNMTRNTVDNPHPNVGVCN